MDFENFSVDTERATTIRSQVEKLKEASRIEGLKLLLQESGRDEQDTSSDPSLPGIGKAEIVRVYEKTVVPTVMDESGTPTDGAPSIYRIESKGIEFKILANGKSVLELSFLPKGQEFVVFYYNEALAADFEAALNAFDEDLSSKKKKSERQAEWKARFSS